MQVFNEINSENKNLSIALGFFDGIHLGHKAVIGSAVSFAKNNNLKSAVITFENHPKCLINNTEPEYILSKSEKLNILESLGVDYVYFLKFTEELSKLSASEYIEFLCNNLEPKAISTGFNHNFGANKDGNSEFLNSIKTKYGFEYFQSPPVKTDDGEIVSSSKIRESLKQGNIELVNKMLGYNYFINETVIEGEKIGRTIGFRTANILYPTNLLNIGKGVYSVDVEYNSAQFKGIANFGIRPSLGNTQTPILEVHILDFEKDIYGEKILVKFKKKIRDERKFKSLDELKAQITKDVGDALWE